MKNLSVFILLLGISLGTYAQDEQTTKGTHTAKGKFVIDANTTLGSVGGVLAGSGTSFILSSADGTTIWNIGAEVGFFVADDFAIKVGFGYGDFDGSSLISYKVGAKYYVASSFPFQVDYSGQGGEDIFGSEKPSYLGLQGGYAFFIGDMVSVEPALRYNLSLNSDFYDNIFQVQIGFSLFFN
jgi:hypothetical protein